jgi:alkaline phosphatase D
MLIMDFFKGDPFDTSVLLWTRAVPVSPDNSSELPDQSMPACVSFKIATSASLSGKPVDTGTAFTSYDVDWTAKLEAKGLKPDTKYFFQFADCANPFTVSPIGSTRTLASPDSEFCYILLFRLTNLAIHHSAPARQVNNGKPLTLAVFSCSQFQAGKPLSVEM